MKKSLGLYGAAIAIALAACATAGGGAGFDDLPDAAGTDGVPATPSDDSGSVATEDGSTPITPQLDASIDAPIDVAPGGNPVGFPCAQNGDCAAGECKPAVAGAAGSICVTPCTAQATCPDNFFCDPATPGSTSGFCVPRSPSHCKTCNTSAECGALSETCGTAAGDTTKACHIDCTIGGAAACPPDFNCETTTLDGTAAKVCRPAGGIGCLDSLGGFCDRVATPQTCARKNAAGTCVGQRTCLAASTRFNSCAAAAPVCRMTCSTTDPAGCTTSYCEEATSGPANCGTCGNACPGYNKANTNVGCEQPTCSFSCKGESYDRDNSKTNGCETVDPYTGNHTLNTATDLGDHGCSDGDTLSIPSAAASAARLPSDTAIHENPAIAGFDVTTGSAPDYYKVRGTGSITCVNNVDLTLTMTGATYPSCYRLFIETNKNTFECNTDATGKCRIDSGGVSQYDDGTTLSIVVSKRNIAACSAAARDNPAYRVTGHL